MIEIAVLPDGWGDARPADIRMLLVDTASHLSEPLRTPLECNLIVLAAPDTDHGSKDPLSYVRTRSFPHPTHCS